MDKFTKIFLLGTITLLLSACVASPVPPHLSVLHPGDCLSCHKTEKALLQRKWALDERESAMKAEFRRMTETNKEGRMRKFTEARDRRQLREEEFGTKMYELLHIESNEVIDHDPIYIEELKKLKFQHSKIMQEAWARLWERRKNKPEPVTWELAD